MDTQAGKAGSGASYSQPNERDYTEQMLDSMPRLSADSLSVDDILGQITSKLDSLSTGASNEDLLEAFISVLDVETSMATFFLESAAWKLDAAVAIYLENMHGGFQNTGSKRTRREGRDQTYGYGDDDDDNGHGAYGRAAAAVHPAPMRYAARQLAIDGLPEGWVATVSRSTGHVYFKHLESGHLQFEVPPGFADEQPRVAANGGSGGGSGSGIPGGSDGFGFGGAKPLTEHDMQTHSTATASATEQLFAFLNAPRADAGGDCDTDVNIGKDDSGDALSDASESETAQRMD